MANKKSGEDINISRLRKTTYLTMFFCLTFFIFSYMDGSTGSRELDGTFFLLSLLAPLASLISFFFFLYFFGKNLRKRKFIISLRYLAVLLAFAVFVYSGNIIRILDNIRFVMFYGRHKELVFEVKNNNKRKSAVMQWSVTGFAGQNYWRYLVYDPNNIYRKELADENDKIAHGYYGFKVEKCEVQHEITHDYIVVFCHLP